MIRMAPTPIPTPPPQPPVNRFGYGNFNSIDAKFMKSAFSYFAGSDGKLSLNEARRAAYFYSDNNDRDVAIAFANLWRGARYGDRIVDGNRDGQVSSNELAALINRKGAIDGYLSFADFTAAPAATPVPTPAPVPTPTPGGEVTRINVADLEEFRNAADENRDGRLSESEFENAAKEVEDGAHWAREAAAGRPIIARAFRIFSANDDAVVNFLRNNEAAMFVPSFRMVNSPKELISSSEVSRRAGLEGNNAQLTKSEARQDVVIDPVPTPNPNPTQFTTQQFKDAVNQLDRNRDGNLTRAEFNHFMSVANLAPGSIYTYMEQNADVIFERPQADIFFPDHNMRNGFTNASKLDALSQLDGNSSNISNEDIRIRRNGGTPTPGTSFATSEFESLIPSFDLNGDGRVTRNEFNQFAARARFTQDSTYAFIQRNADVFFYAQPTGAFLPDDGDRRYFDVSKLRQWSSYDGNRTNLSQADIEQQRALNRNNDRRLELVPRANG